MSTPNNTTHAEQQVVALKTVAEEPAEEPVQKELQKPHKRKRDDDAETAGRAEEVPTSPSKKSKIIVDLTTEKKNQVLKIKKKLLLMMS